MKTRWLLAIALPILLLPALAAAQAGTTPTDALTLAAQLYAFIRTGHGTAAAGVALLMVAWGLRSGLGAQWAFWKKPIGGYLLGFGLPAILYLGTALESNNPFTLTLLGNALAAGWVAAGQWEHLRDVLTALRGGSTPSSSSSSTPAAPPAPPPPPSIVKRLAFALAIASSACAGGTASGTFKTMTGAFASCGKADLNQTVKDIEGNPVPLINDVTTMVKANGAGLEAQALAVLGQVGIDAFECAFAAVEAVLTPAPTKTPGTGAEPPPPGLARVRAVIAQVKASSK